MAPCGRNVALFPPHPFTSWTTAISWRSQNTTGPDWGTLVPPGPSHTPAPYGSLHVRKRSSRWQNLPSAAGLALVACRRQPGGACTGRGRLIQLPAGLWGGGGLLEISPSLLSPCTEKREKLLLHCLPPPLVSFTVASLLVPHLSSGPMYYQLGCMQATRKLWGLLLEWLSDIFYQG